MPRLDRRLVDATALGQVALLMLWFGAGAYAADLVGVPRILEGDHLVIDGREFYLEGIDAPEHAQLCLDASIKPWECGTAARDQLIKKAGNQPWTCDMRGHDGLGRLLATCRVDGEDIARWMVRSGWALSFKHCSLAYDVEQADARRSGAGLWAGAFIAPRDWRNRNRYTNILGSISVPVEAHRFLLPTRLPMNFEVKTSVPSCYPTAGDRVAKIPMLTETARTTPLGRGVTGLSGTEQTATNDGSRCDSDLQCFAEKHALEASKACEKSVELPANFRWINSWYESKFDRVLWKSQSAGILTYIGDKIEYRDGLTKWTRYAYECDFDGVARRVLDVRVHPAQSVVGGR